MRHDLSGFFSDLEGWSLKLVLFINYMYLRHMPFLKHEEFNIRKCIHDLSGHVDRFIWVGLWISCYICTDANSLQIQSRFRVLFSKFISNDRWSFSMTHNKHIKRQFLPFISVRQGVGFLLLLLWIMANILRFFRNCFFIYIFFYKLLLHGRIHGKKCHQIILNVYGDIRQFSFVINTFFYIITKGIIWRGGMVTLTVFIPGLKCWSCWVELVYHGLKKKY